MQLLNGRAGRGRRDGRQRRAAPVGRPAHPRAGRQETAAGPQRAGPAVQALDGARLVQFGHAQDLHDALVAEPLLEASKTFQTWKKKATRLLPRAL